MKIQDCEPTDEVFTFEQESPPRTYHFNASALMRASIARTVSPICTYIDVDKGLADHVRLNNGIELHHLANIDTSEPCVPIMIAEFDNGQHVVIDGNHRLVAYFNAGSGAPIELRAMIYKPALWQAYLVEYGALESSLLSQWVGHYQKQAHAVDQAKGEPS